MAGPFLYNRIWETTTTTGTGNLSLGGARTGFVPFSTVGNGNLVWYTISDTVNGAWEEGIGTYNTSGNTLSRSLILSSSNGNAVVSLAAGTKDVFASPPAEMLEMLNAFVSQFRLTLTSGTPLTTSDVTAATSVYMTPLAGARIKLYSGKGWLTTTSVERSFPLTLSSVPAILSNGSATVTGLTGFNDQIVRGMLISGTGIQANTVVSSVDSVSQITMSKTATAGGSQSLTFKVPANKNLDLYAVLNGNPYQSLFRFQAGNLWSSDTARADALTTLDGVYVNNAVINSGDYNSIAANQGIYLGTVRTTSTDGQTEDSVLRRYLWNNYNRQRRKLVVVDATGSWSYASSTWRQARGSTANKFEYVIGIADVLHEATVIVGANDTTNANHPNAAPGFDTTSASSADIAGFSPASAATIIVSIVSMASTYPAVGYHFTSWNERSDAGGSVTFYGTTGGGQGGMVGYIMG